MRYSFHGKVRATGQQVDGFVEANSSAEAIDRLADQGIIGVHTVRPEARKPKNSVVLSGQEFLDEEEPPRQGGQGGQAETPALPAPTKYTPPPPSQPVIVQMAPFPTGDAGQEATLASLIQKVTVLIERVEKMLATPTQVIYQGGGGGHRGDAPARSKRVARSITDEQNTTLRDIFQKNLDLRRGVSSPTGVVNPAPAPVAVPTTDKPEAKPVRAAADAAKTAAPAATKPPAPRPAKSQPVASGPSV